MKLYSRLEIPDERKETSVTEEEAEFIHGFLKKRKIKNTLEVGLAFGCSAAHIIDATRSEHIAIDPFQEEYGSLGVKNLRSLGFGKLLVLKPKLSHEALPELLKESKKFQFAFIDGGHKFDEIFIDFYYIDLLLEQGGYVLFDDSWMRSTQLVVSFIDRNKKNYKRITRVPRNFVMFQKTGEDGREWYHFREFYTLKGVISHGWYRILKRMGK